MFETSFLPSCICHCLSIRTLNSKFLGSTLRSEHSEFVQESRSKFVSPSKKHNQTVQREVIGKRNSFFLLSPSDHQIRATELVIGAS